MVLAWHVVPEGHVSTFASQNCTFVLKTLLVQLVAQATLEYAAALDSVPQHTSSDLQSACDEHWTGVAPAGHVTSHTSCMPPKTDDVTQHA
jgi:hypothetical protein